MSRIFTGKEEVAATSFRTTVAFCLGKQEIVDNEPRSLNLVLSAAGAAGAAPYFVCRLQGELMCYLRNLSLAQRFCEKLAGMKLHEYRLNGVIDPSIRDYSIQKVMP
ncbi:hypothetical protein FGIG_11061 [Fasciola gigantica]|uniref:Uncharacterized protein n=1 Tax=Fasciola gigantica TaxID=46835 RepID=A0A504Z6S1_FASGI|nr:hypothetical protein FGIG_11061 [Fasciola gigantica]